LSERNAAKAVGREVESSDDIQAVGKDNSDACTIWFEKEVSGMNKHARFSQERKSRWQVRCKWRVSKHGGGTRLQIRVDPPRHSPQAFLVLRSVIVPDLKSCDLRYWTFYGNESSR